jgi:undecaprenyl-diphosphatase
MLAIPAAFPSNPRVSALIVILLGIIEGVTEFLPISSTGHLLLAEHWLRLPQQPSEVFNVVIQGGAVLAVLMAFAGRLRRMAREWRLPTTRDYCLKLGLAFVVTMVGALALKRLGLTLPKTAAPVAWATLIGGVVILGIEYGMRHDSEATYITWTMALAIGGAQVLAAAFPGTSRSGASILMGLLFSLSRPAATEFSFLLGVPTLLAASGYELMKYARHPEGATEPAWQIALGTVVAAITAFIVVKWLLHFVQNHTFILFGWYRIVLGGLILLLL